MGELARLWIVLMPWLILLSAGSFEAEDQSVGISRRWAITLALQFAMGLTLVMRVHGFHVPG